ncbi:uncharacterized protein LOC118735071 [Rhagoletis pomonella]|uniref:uncharacterized protein LOC118735071 n=3 Tax=Rhagoletis TaxID=28609 RepID=UPI00177E96D1|nr:uncharacterized protein LOC118735071 [Rhagoletis pomonella]
MMNSKNVAPDPCTGKNAADGHGVKVCLKTTSSVAAGAVPKEPKRLTILNVAPGVSSNKPLVGSGQLASGLQAEPARPIDLSCQSSTSLEAASTPLEGSSKAAPGEGDTGTRKSCTDSTTDRKPLEGRKSDQRKGVPGPSGSRTKKEVRPAVRAKRDRRAASRLLRKFGNDPVPESMREVVERARGVLSESRERPQEGNAANKPAPTHSRPRELGSKRQRSADNVDAAPKRPKTSNANSPLNPPRALRAFSDVAKDHLILAVMDRGHPEGNLTADNWRSVLVGLCRVYKEILRKNPGPAPTVRDAGLYQGRIKLVSCADERSARLYKEAISSLGELWPSADLVAVHRDEIPCKPRARAWVPEEPSSPEEILDIIQVSNDALPALDWKVVKVSEVREQQRYITLVINEESLPILADCKGVISYGFYSITLKTQKGNEGKMIEPGNTEGEPEAGNLPPKGGPISGAENALSGPASNQEVQEVLEATCPVVRSDSAAETDSDTQSVSGDGSVLNRWTREFGNLLLTSDSEDADDTIVEAFDRTPPEVMDGDDIL